MEIKNRGTFHRGRNTGLCRDRTNMTGSHRRSSGLVRQKAKKGWKAWSQSTKEGNTETRGVRGLTFRKNRSFSNWGGRLPQKAHEWQREQMTLKEQYGKIWERPKPSTERLKQKKKKWRKVQLDHGKAN